LRIPSRLQALRDRLLIDEALSPLRHDLRNKLASVRNAAFYLKRKHDVAPPPDWSADPRVAQMFDVIKGELVAAEALMARQAPPAPSEAASADVAVVAAALCEEIGRVAGVMLVLPRAAAPRARIDGDELAVALYCVVENAVDAGARTITVTVEGNGQDGQIVVDVIDDGGGGADARAFEPGFTTREARLGLGLNVARRIVQRADGALTLTAAPGGTRARLCLPEATA
jgi:signal transduction histidine kinase